MNNDDTYLELYRTHRPALIEYATPLVGDRMHAEDVVQEAFLRLAGLDRADTPGQHSVARPLAYLYRCVRNLSVDWNRRRRLEADCRDNGAMALMGPAPTTPPEQQAGRDETLRRVTMLVDDLPDDARTALRMHRVDGCTLQQIADRLDISVTTAHRLVKRAILHVTVGLAAND